MTARVLTIKERHLQTPGELASLADFTCTEGDEVDAAVVVNNPDLGLYCLDDEARRAVFVQLPPGVDLTKAPFVYQTQGEQAQRLVAVPYDAFVQLAAELPKVETFILVYGTGRSGSTLLSHIFNASGAVVSLSEPDVTDQFAFIRAPDGGRDAELSGLLDSTVRFLFKPSRYERTTACALKFRGEGVRAMDLYRATFSGTKNLLLYRDAVGWVTSFYRVFRNFGTPELEPARQWAEYLGRSLGRTPDEVRAKLGEDEDVSLVEALAVWWMFVMEDYLEQHARGVTSLAVRYDDLNAHREAVLNEVFTYCCLPTADVRKALGAFDKDAQAGTPLARADAKRGNAVRLTDQQLADIHAVLQRHPVVNTPDFVLPGTLVV